MTNPTQESGSTGTRVTYAESPVRKRHLPTARHPQTLLATHFNGQPLTVEHGAPLRLLVPVKLGLKDVKAITRITYTAEESGDYWAERGYSHYDGI
jgi:DMSO/TMAO reductase YedYZ molybdopterin-dependent catalytic subunit